MTNNIIGGAIPLIITVEHVKAQLVNANDTFEWYYDKDTLLQAGLASDGKTIWVYQLNRRGFRDDCRVQTEISDKVLQLLRNNDKSAHHNELCNIINELIDANVWEIQYLWAEGQEAEDRVDAVICKLNDAMLSNNDTNMKRYLHDIIFGGGGDAWRIVHNTGDVSKCDEMYKRIREVLR